MKTNKYKNIASILAVVATISFSSVMQAEEITLPKISAPIVLQEGTQRELSAAQIAELLPWAKDSKVFLVDLLENTQHLSSFDQLDRLSEGLKQVVEESAMKNPELLMRYFLNRALVLTEILNNETNTDAVGSVDAKVRVLRASIKMAIIYYDVDLKMLTKKSTAPFVMFGQDYFDFLSELNKSIFDASAQYAIQRTALEWFQWDLYRDLNNTSYAPQIVKINNSLKTFPLKTKNDGQSISYLRQMKSIALQVRGKDANKPKVTNTDSVKGKDVNKPKVTNTDSSSQSSRYAMNSYEAKQFKEDTSLKKFEALNKGAFVLYQNAVRTVEYTTDNNKVILSYVPGVYSQSIAPRNEVEKLFTSHGTYQRGDIILHDNTSRNLEYVSERATLVLTYEPGLFSQAIVDYTTASEAVGAYKHLKIGDKVLYNNAIRTIKYLDLNGRVVLHFVSGVYSEDYTTVNDVSKVSI